jgi:tetratricopeptide (TPR) repeat protein
VEAEDIRKSGHHGRASFADKSSMRTLVILIGALSVFFALNSFTQDDEIVRLERNMKENPADFESIEKSAHILIARKNYIACQDILNDYLSIDSINAQALYLYGRIMDLTDNIPEAMGYYLLAISHDSTLWRAHRDLAFLYDIFADYENTNRYMKKALSFSATPESLYYDLGYSFDMLDQPDSAMSYYHLALKFDPDDYQASLNMGAIWAGRGEIDSARIYTERSLRTNPDSPEACFNLAEIMAIDGDTAAAISYFSETLALNPGAFAARKRLGELHEALGDSALAKIYFEEFLDSAPLIYVDDISEIRDKLNRYR